MKKQKKYALRKVVGYGLVSCVIGLMFLGCNQTFADQAMFTNEPIDQTMENDWEYLGKGRMMVEGGSEVMVYVPEILTVQDDQEREQLEAKIVKLFDVRGFGVLADLEDERFGDTDISTYADVNQDGKVVRTNIHTHGDYWHYQIYQHKTTGKKLRVFERLQGHQSHVSAPEVEGYTLGYLLFPFNFRTFFDDLPESSPEGSDIMNKKMNQFILDHLVLLHKDSIDDFAIDGIDMEHISKKVDLSAYVKPIDESSDSYYDNLFEELDLATLPTDKEIKPDGIYSGTGLLLYVPKEFARTFQTSDEGTQTDEPTTSDSGTQTKATIHVIYRNADGTVYQSFDVQADKGTILDGSDLEMLPDDMMFTDDFTTYEVKGDGTDRIERFVKKQTADNGTQTDNPTTSDSETQTKASIHVIYKNADGTIYKEFDVQADKGSILDGSDLEMLPDDMDFTDDFMFYEVKGDGHDTIERTVKKQTSDSETQTEVPNTSENGTQTDDMTTSENGTQTDDMTTSENGTQTDDVTTPENGTQTEEPNTSENGTQTEEPNTSENGTQTEEPNTSESGTQTDDVTTSENGTQTEEPSTSESGTQTDNATTSDNGTQTEEPSTSENTQTEEPNKSEGSTQTEEPNKSENGTQTEVPNTSENGTQTNELDGKGNDTQTDKPNTSDDGTQTDNASTSENGTQTDNASTSETGTQTDNASTSESDTQTDNASTSESDTQTEEPNTSDNGTQTEEPNKSENGTQTKVPNTSENGTQTDNVTTSENGTQTDNVTTSDNGTQTDEPNTSENGTQTEVPNTSDTGKDESNVNKQINSTKSLPFVRTSKTLPKTGTHATFTHMIGLVLMGMTSVFGFHKHKEE